MVEISLAGIPSYGLDPKVINSQTVTPERMRELLYELVISPRLVLSHHLNVSDL